MKKRAFVKKLKERLQQNLPFIQVVLGPRQVGKTTGVKQVIEEWPGPHIYATADSPVVLSPDWIITEWSKARALGQGTILVIDEIQKVPGWSSTVKKLYDEDRDLGGLQVVLLGSASFALQSEMQDSLLGRYEIIHVTHWDYQECLNHFEWQLNTFLKFGGYPAAAKLHSDVERWQAFMKNSVIEPIISRDILAMRDIGNLALFRQTLSLVLSYPAQEISYQKLLGQLQDRGNAKTVKTYIEILQSAFLLTVLEKYSGSAVRSRSSSPKLIPLAPALIHAMVDPGKIDTDPMWRGRVFESTVISHLLRAQGGFFYWRDGNFEVDLVWTHNEQILGVEIKSNSKKTAKGLRKFCQRFSNARAIILDEELAKSCLLCEDITVRLSELYSAAGSR